MIKEVKTVCFVGAGTMGCYNSLISAMAGYDVLLYDISDTALHGAPERHRYWAEKIMAKSGGTMAEVEAALKRITLTTDSEVAAKGADLLSESVPEQLELKRRTHQKFDTLLPPHAIMTTNTSTLLLSDIESAVVRRDKFAAMHFHQPYPLVDIVAGPLTSPDTIDIIKRFVESQGQQYVLLRKERSGYLHNAMLGAIFSSSLMLAVLFGEDIHAVDRAWMLNRNAVRGPFAMMDYVGLNVIWDSVQEFQKRESYIKDDVIDAIRAFLRPFIDGNHLGQKSGRGFYQYPEPAYQNPGFIEGMQENTKISETILYSFLVTALSLLADDHADMEDIDRSWSVIHESEIGPFATMDLIGLGKVKEKLLERAETYENLLGRPGTIQLETDRAVAVLDFYIRQNGLGKKAGKGFYRYFD